MKTTYMIPIVVLHNASNFSFKMLIKGVGDFCRVVSRPVSLSIYKCLTLHVEMSIISSLIEEIHMQDKKKKTNKQKKQHDCIIIWDQVMKGP